MYDKILENLNEEQRKAVLQKDGPVLIIAGAGSGKTRVLTSKIALLLKDGISPREILAVTFTKKAAGEMKGRVRAMVGDLAKGLSIGTFHSVFIQYLRLYHEYVRFPQNFTIYDENDSESCIKACTAEVLFGADWNNKEVVKALSDDEKKARKSLLNKYKPHDMRGRISIMKNNLILPKDYREMPELLSVDRKYGREHFAEIYSLYMKKCYSAGAMDFDDILVYMYLLLKKNAVVRQDLAERFTYILVDEFQDTNVVQNDIIQMLAAAHRNICVVGDDSQSIYAFRGAKIQNILGFKKEYPQLKTFRLETNYRSTGKIVDAANRLIEHNEHRLPKTCRAHRGDGEDIRLEFLADDREEARFVKDAIQEAVRRGAHYSDFAVLYRTNAQSRALEDELLKSQVPYVIYSGMSFFDRAEVKDVLAYFRLAVNPNDDEAFKRICNRPARGISDATLSVVMTKAAAMGIPLFKVAAAATTDNIALKEKPCGALREFTAKMSELKERCGKLDAYDAARVIVEETGILDLYQGEEGEDGLKKSNNIRELLNSILYFIEDKKDEYENDLPDGPLKISLVDYLENIALLSNADTRTDDEDTERVALMTSHCSKGLEFRTVFVVGVEEGLFPLIKEDSTRFDEEEERRLFYVSITRAMDRLVLTSCDWRWQYGSRDEREVSRFVKEMELPEGEE